MASRRIVRRPVRRTPNNHKKTNDKTMEILQVVGIVIVISLIIFAFYLKKKDENFSRIKINPNQFIVYTKYSNKETEYIKEVPFLNLKADVFKMVNADIKEFCDPYMDSPKSVITYEYDINGIILSLVVKVINYDTIYAPEPTFKSYNINLEREEVIANNALFQYFNVSNSMIESKIKRGLQDQYSEILEEGYYTSAECSYSCFLANRGIEHESYLRDVTYAIKNGTLIAYKSMTAHSLSGEEEYYTDDKFEFAIAKAPSSVSVKEE